jgi:hypothetical protein
MSRANYNPDSPHDISDFLKLVGERYMEGADGINRATRLIEEMAQSQNGRRLLYNCHRVVSAQIGTVTEGEMLAMMQ